MAAVTLVRTLDTKGPRPEMTVAHIRPADAETFSFTRHPAGDIVAWTRSAGGPS